MKKILKAVGLYKPLIKLKSKLSYFKKIKTQKKELKKRAHFYASFIKQNDLVFDVGANMGNRIEAFLHITPNIVAIEPQPSCINFLKTKFGKKIHIEPVGLSYEEGEANMFIADESTISSFSKEFISTLKQTRFKQHQWDKQIKVPITTLDNLIKKYGTPHFCKIDVKGFEYEVLRGLDKALPILSFEYCVPEFTENVTQCLSHLHIIDSNFEYNFSVQETMSWHEKDWKSYDDFLEIVISEAFSKTLFGDIYVKQPSTIIN